MSSLRSFLLLFFTCLRIYDTSDNFTTKNFLKDPESIVSYNGTLKTTYVSLSNTTNGGYVGSYYNKLPTMKDAWIANRNIPLTNGQKHVLSTNITVSHAAMSLYEAQHLESGHLVLSGSYNNNIRPSFDHVNTILPQVSLMYRKGNDKYSMIQACKSPSDPSQSIFLRPRSRLFNVNTLPRIDFKVNLLSHWITIQTDLRGDTTLMLPSPPFYELLDQGSVREPFLHGSKWIILRQAPGNECGIHRTRINGSGNLHSPVCKCLNGFKQSSGRPRTRPLLCGIQGGKEDGFSDLVVFIDYILVYSRNKDDNWSEGLDQDTCRSHCLLDRSCAAYAFDSGVGCYTQTFRIEVLIPFRGLSDSRLGNNEKQKLITGVASISGTATLVAIVYFLCRRKAKQGKKIMLLDILNGNQRLDKFEELPLFKFDKLAAATSNFQDSNKIGQGGFGRVYKGTMEDGQEVAIKRLSETSRQGMEEFMNEALLISKLQHRNLVKLLGCCVERQERLLIYEYMPNKSLDAFIFDPNKKRILDWRKRYIIVEGICRGLLYLHRDSRLKIIHRDLKAANILLDEDLNQIISDFGMARIFGTSQSEADTTRVAGTCGYMSPEYAFKGRFSEKSDVFSFGVLLLEIITGKRTRWHDDESSLSLVGHVWKQWTENNIISLIDPLLAHQDFEAEISKCIHIGLLCVQENAQDRPDISAVILMLSALNTASFQKPNPPGFTRLMCDTSSTPAQIHQSSSMNGLSISQISCR